MYIFYILIIVMFLSCECVPTLDSPKIILPTQFGKVAFINMLDDVDYINIYQRGISVADSVKNMLLDKQDINIHKIEPQKIEIGLTNISIFSSKLSSFNTSNGIFSAPILSFIADIELNKNYLAIVYGKSKSSRCLFICDTVGLVANNSVGLRFINLSSESVVFSTNSSSVTTDIPLTSFFYSKLYLFEAIDDINNISISVSAGNNILATLNIKLEKNSIYNILYGASSNRIEVIKYVL